MRDDATRRAFIAVCAIAGALAVPLSAVATLVSAAIGGLLAYVGLSLWAWSGLQALLKPDAPIGFERVVRSVAFLALGLIVGCVFLAVIRLIVEPVVPAAGTRIAAAGTLPIWRRAVIIFVAAVGEEVLFRLLLVSLVAGLATRVLKRSNRTPEAAVTWTAIAVSAILFAGVHLPAWSAATPLTLGIVLMVIALNAVGALVFGYVFVRYGIVAAMLTHAGGDCAIQFIGPLT